MPSNINYVFFKDTIKKIIVLENGFTNPYGLLEEEIVQAYENYSYLPGCFRVADAPVSKGAGNTDFHAGTVEGVFQQPSEA